MKCSYLLISVSQLFDSAVREALLIHSDIGLADRLLIFEYSGNPLPTYGFRLAHKHFTVLNRVMGKGLSFCFRARVDNFKHNLQGVGLLRFAAVRLVPESYVMELARPYQHLKFTSGKAYV